MAKFGFERLDVWQNAIDLTVKLYKITETFPKEEVYNLTSQIRRAAISVSSNIAEGNYRDTANDKARFITIAYGSVMEIYNQMIVANKLGYTSEDDLSVIRNDISLIAKQLTKLKDFHLKK